MGESNINIGRDRSEPLVVVDIFLLFSKEGTVDEYVLSVAVNFKLKFPAKCVIAAPDTTNPELLAVISRDWSVILYDSENDLLSKTDKYNTFITAEYSFFKMIMHHWNRNIYIPSTFTELFDPETLTIVGNNNHVVMSITIPTDTEG